LSLVLQLTEDPLTVIFFLIPIAEVTKSMLEAEDTVRAIRHLTENFGEQAEEYPLIITRPEFKKFKVFNL